MNDLEKSHDQLVAELLHVRERVAALEALDSATLRAALNAAVNAIVITDRAGRILWVNPAFCTLTGYTVTETVGRNPRDLVRSGHHDPAFFREMWETILSGGVWRGETVNRRKDGSLFTEEQTITPVRDAGGEISHFVAVKQDITDRKRAEAELRLRAQMSALRAAVGLSLTSAHSLADALQQCADAFVAQLGVALAGIWTLNDRDGRLALQANAGHSGVNKRSGEIPPGHVEVTRIAHDRRAYMTNAVIGDSRLLNQEWAHRERIVAFAGIPLIVDGRVNGVLALFAQQALSDAETEALASVADHIALGIERHRSAAALSTAEERMRFALENANVGVWDMDFVTGALRWSETHEAHYGFQPGTFDGTFEAFVERIHPDDRAAVLETVGAAKRLGSEFTVENRALWPDGTVQWLTSAGRILLDSKGEPARGVGISLDVTERHTLESQYRQAQKMEAVGRLAGGVAHDFNNLLTAILGYCELLLPDFHPGHPHRANLEEIQKAGARAAGLTRQLLAFSRRQIIEPTWFDLSLVVGEMRPMLERLIGEDVTVVLRLGAEPALVKADRGQVEQVLMNLVLNARDAMPTGGTLTIETTEVELDDDYARTHLEAKPGQYVALTVTDTGSGMTPAVQARLFEPFFTTKEAGKGTGLGLATVHGIVKQSGGSVGVYSEVGKGTSFHVYFPRSEPGQTTIDPAAAPVAQRESRGETVLVVEDAEGLLDLARMLLERQGYTVLVARNVDDALRKMEENPSVDVLLTDVVMPGGSGPELAAKAIELRPGLRVIYMSGYTEDHIVRHGVLNPDVAFLHKPFTSESLGRKIREVLGR